MVPSLDIPNICDLQSVEVNSTQVNSDSAALDTYFQAEFREEDSDDEDDGPAVDVDGDSEPHIVDNPRTQGALAWADKFILETRRKGGRQTENSVLKQWKVCEDHTRNPSKPLSLYKFQSWTSQAIDSGQLHDLIADANHTIEYLKYAATRELFNTRGQKKATTDRLSAVRVLSNTENRAMLTYTYYKVFSKKNHDHARSRSPTPRR